MPVPSSSILPAALCRAAAHCLGGFSKKALAKGAAQGIGPRFKRLRRVHVRSLRLLSELGIWLAEQA